MVVCIPLLLAVVVSLKNYAPRLLPTSDEIRYHTVVLAYEVKANNTYIMIFVAPNPKPND